MFESFHPALTPCSVWVLPVGSRALQCLGAFNQHKKPTLLGFSQPALTPYSVWVLPMGPTADCRPPHYNVWVLPICTRTLSVWVLLANSNVLLLPTNPQALQCLFLSTSPKPYAVFGSSQPAPKLVCSSQPAQKPNNVWVLRANPKALQCLFLPINQKSL